MLNVVTFKWHQRKDEKESIPSQSIIKYGPEHINTFFSMFDRNYNKDYNKICITDDGDGLDKSINVIPLWNKCRDLGGCYNRLYVFSNDMKSLIGDRFICFDVDVVIVGDITDLIHQYDNSDFIYYRMRSPTGDHVKFRMNNGMFMMNAGSRDFVWSEFRKEVLMHGSIPSNINWKTKENPGTDQAWCNYKLDIVREECWGLYDGIYDMRLDFIENNNQDLPNDAKIVMFPGPRDPSQKSLSHYYPWIKDHYK